MKSHHRHSIRMKGFDYATPWWYYVTICVHQHFPFLGKVEDGKVALSIAGRIAQECWEQIPEHFPNVELDYFVIMPNHIHGVIIINEKKEIQDSRDVKFNVPTKKEYFSQISPKKNSLSTIVRTFKAAVTRECKRKGYNRFCWQSSFYDRIIRNEKELFEIRKYIEYNPLKWEFEKEIPENIEL